MTGWYGYLYGGALAVISVLLILCLIRVVLGPRIADRIMGINMMGTLVVIMICILAFTMNEGYLIDIGIIYVMLSFLSVVLLTKVYMGNWRERNVARNGKKEEKA